MQTFFYLATGVLTILPIGTAEGKWQTRDSKMLLLSLFSDTQKAKKRPIKPKKGTNGR